jgi:Ser/Thr protein kinase RdoA (MazF antagonist)
MYVFVKDARTVDVCTNPDQAYAAAWAFGDFQASLIDLPGPALHETIPYFHHTPRRFAALEEALRRDPENRAGGARREIDFCLAHRPLASAITDLIAAGRLPERVTHNDTKINNVMLDNQSGAGVCVIDLDTVMTGCALYDFGDMVRTMPRTAAEDEQDLAKVAIDLTLFEALTRGYLAAGRPFLTPRELEELPIAGQVITFTIGIRFLTDYLLGDVYFKIHRPGQNLDRARVQFKMVESMEQQLAAMTAIVRKYS